MTDTCAEKKYMESEIDNNTLSYYVKDDIVYLNIVEIDRDENSNIINLKSFLSFLVECCDKLKKYKAISLIGLKSEYEGSKNMYDLFNVKVLDDKYIEMKCDPDKLPRAMAKAWGYDD
jgi:hypothetical protein